MKPFLDTHLRKILVAYTASKAPLDLLLSKYFKDHRALGANDRRVIGETLYGMVRWKSLLEALDPKGDPIACYRRIDWKTVFDNPCIPTHARVALSPLLYRRFVAVFGEEKAKDLGRIFNTPAPITIRVNLLKTTREALLERWQGTYLVTPSEQVGTALSFSKREPLFSLPEFKEGLFEVQDEGSQRIAALIQAGPTDWILDYCSGSGGKTLAVAPHMQGKGQIYLHDVRAAALLEAKKRLKRAGVQNAQCLPPGHEQLQRLKGRCDWVLADVPCSGTGTLRRNPDQKWKIDGDMLARLQEEQRGIVREAFRYVKPEGRLVYATCSILPEENGEQTAYFLKNFSLVLEQELSLLPEEGGIDGFYAAVFRKTKNLVESSHGEHA